MTFITDEGVFCHKVFQNQISRNLEFYVDDMLIKSKTLDDHLINLEENFSVIKAKKVRINPTKCTFGVVVGKSLGFMLTERGIKVNLVICRAILEMRSSTTLKEV